MNLQTLTTRFQLHQTLPSAVNQGLIEAAVLVPLQQNRHQLELIFTRRPEDTRHHPGQICFPGGKREPQDRDLQHTAIRETIEELGVAEAQIQLIGELPALVTRTGFYVKPFLAALSAKQMNPDPREVAEMFKLPATPLLQRNSFRQQTINIQSQTHTVYGTWSPYGLIWGMTAHILVNLIEQLAISVTDNDVSSLQDR